MGKDMIVCNSDLIQLIFTQDCKRDPNRQVAGTKAAKILRHHELKEIAVPGSDFSLTQLS